MFLSDPFWYVGSYFANNDQRFVRHLMAMARGLPDGLVPPLSSFGLLFVGLLRPSASFGDF
eukprot:12877111-Heterocapsa_arctica.AAC.1